MSYSITITGHKDTADADEVRAFEEETAAKARELVKQLDGVTSASGAFGTIGAQDLRAEQ